MATLGYILLVLGLIATLYWQVRFLVVAYNRNLWWFFGCLFVPLVDWIFLFLNFKATAKPFGLSLLGLLVAGIGGWMAGVAWPD
jgi:FtsH-binding integral membrane protein